MSACQAEVNKLISQLRKTYQLPESAQQVMVSTYALSIADSLEGLIKQPKQDRALLDDLKVL